ncbi:MnhB domain-containing protein [Sulfurimonas sp.]|uniref:MnhB domain-containing protein n=1 Tax=Sulfurimonas sp. TaxID=2022749 RepID=UPI0019DB2070|nr:MnhB domain-containing protein [Sulfurimonas sp.]MBE0514521.1 sodium:proton antiporter [Sulfurimonas sp.]
MAALFLGMLFFMVATMPPFSPKLDTLVQADLAMSGVSHDVTAVLLNFRALDTLLEVGVVLLALMGIQVVSPHFRYKPYTEANTITDIYIAILLPVIILSALYLLLAGSYKSGGAFVASALLAGGIIILKLTKPKLFVSLEKLHLRFLSALGLLFFVGIGVLTLIEGLFLQYPLSYASTLILMIETLLMFSLAIILASFFINAVQDLE